MSHALPAPLHDVDAKRIAATAFAIALHLVALMLLLAPMRSTPPVATVESPPIQIFYKEKERPPIPPPQPPREIERPRPQTQAPPVRMPIVEHPPVIHDTPGPMDIPYEPIQQPPVETTFGPPPSGPIALTVIESPAPAYPAIAIRQGITGKVVLRIEVDASGRPVSGVVEQSSGSTILDNAALKVVLAKWRFVPAQHGGQPISATALVPIVFTLD